MNTKTFTLVTAGKNPAMDRLGILMGTMREMEHKERLAAMLALMSYVERNA